MAYLEVVNKTPEDLKNIKAFLGKEVSENDKRYKKSLNEFNA
jgi:hypothetical protein